MAYLDLAGSDGVDVFVGGLGSATTVAFADVAAHPALSGRRRILIDLVGSGWSDHDDVFPARVEDHAAVVADTLDALAVRGVRLVGHSLGGSVAIVLAATRPELVHHLVVVEPNLDPGVGTVSAQISAWTEPRFVDTGHRQLVATLLDEAGPGHQDTAEYARTMRRWSPVTLHRTAVSLLADRTPTFREQLAGLDLPRTYVSGALSAERLGPVRRAGCEIRVVPAAGHVVMADNLDGFIAALGG